MDQETYEKQKAFAGEKVPSMHRRMVGHDYQERQMYMITMVTGGPPPFVRAGRRQERRAARLPRPSAHRAHRAGALRGAVLA